MSRWLRYLAPLLLLAAPLACATSPPRQPDDLCEIFREHRHWHRGAASSYRRWGVPEAVQMAFVHQESRFVHDARPPRRKILWVLPGPRLSSAYGYGQVKDGTWRDYQRATGRGGADRDDFEDVADFIGWYGHFIHRQTGIPKHDAYHLYLAYHEGPTGYRRGDQWGKAWLRRVARGVQARASRYQSQYAGCRQELEQGGGWWPFW